jgi:hypothetical protein
LSVPKSTARSLASVQARPVPLATRRHYTSEKGKEKEDAVDADVEQSKTAEDEAALKSEADNVSAKMQAKQDEIVDLTVSLYIHHKGFCEIVTLIHRVVYGTRKLIS